MRFSKIVWNIIKLHFLKLIKNNFKERNRMIIQPYMVNSYMLFIVYKIKKSILCKVYKPPFILLLSPVYLIKIFSIKKNDLQ